MRLVFDPQTGQMTPAQVNGHTVRPFVKPTKEAAPKPQFSEAQVTLNMKRHDELQQDEQDAWQAVGELGEIGKLPDGKSFIDPATKREVPMNSLRRQNIINRYNRAMSDAQAAQKAAGEIRQRFGWGEFANGQGGGQPAAQPAADPKKGGAPAATIKESELRARATAAGKDPDAAVKLAAAHGVQVLRGQ